MTIKTKRRHAGLILATALAISTIHPFSVTATDSWILDPRANQQVRQETAISPQVDPDQTEVLTRTQQHLRDWNLRHSTWQASSKFDQSLRESVYNWKAFLASQDAELRDVLHAVEHDRELETVASFFRLTAYVLRLGSQISSAVADYQSHRNAEMAGRDDRPSKAISIRRGVCREKTCHWVEFRSIVTNVAGQPDATDQLLKLLTAVDLPAGLICNQTEKTCAPVYREDLVPPPSKTNPSAVPQSPAGNRNPTTHDPATHRSDSAHSDITRVTEKFTKQLYTVSKAATKGTESWVPIVSSMVVDLHPIGGPAKAIIETLSGRDPITKQKINRVFAALGVVPVFGGGLKGTIKLRHAHGLTKWYHLAKAPAKQLALPGQLKKLVRLRDRERLNVTYWKHLTKAHWRDHCRKHCSNLGIKARNWNHYLTQARSWLRNDAVVKEVVFRPAKRGRQAAFVVVERGWRAKKGRVKLATVGKDGLLTSYMPAKKGYVRSIFEKKTKEYKRQYAGRSAGDWLGKVLTQPTPK